MRAGRIYAGGVDGVLLETWAEEGPGMYARSAMGMVAKYLRCLRACLFLGALRTTTNRAWRASMNECVWEQVDRGGRRLVWQQPVSVSEGILMNTIKTISFNTDLLRGHVIKVRKSRR